MQRVVTSDSRLNAHESEIGIIPCHKIPDEIRKRFQIPANGNVVAIEGADVCPSLNGHAKPWECSTFGIGQLIAKAADDGATNIFIGAGQLGSVDLGVGALQAIGIELLDGESRPMSRSCPRDWDKVSRIVGEPWPHIPQIHIITSGDSVLLGPNGAVARYASTNRIGPIEATEFERALGATAKKLCDALGIPRTSMARRGSGEGGGLVFSLAACCDAVSSSAAEFIPEWTQLDARVDEADLVIAGLERIDEISLGTWNLQRPLTAAARAQKHSFLFAEVIARDLKLPAKATLTSMLPPGMAVETARKTERKRFSNALHTVFSK